MTSATERGVIHVSLPFSSRGYRAGISTCLVIIGSLLSINSARFHATPSLQLIHEQGLPWIVWGALFIIAAIGIQAPPMVEFTGLSVSVVRDGWPPKIAVTRERRMVPLRFWAWTMVMVLHAWFVWASLRAALMHRPPTHIVQLTHGVLNPFQFGVGLEMIVTIGAATWNSWRLANGGVGS